MKCVTFVSETFTRYVCVIFNVFLFCVFIFSLSFIHFLFIVYLVYDFIINMIYNERVAENSYASDFGILL